MTDLPRGTVTCFFTDKTLRESVVMGGDGLGDRPQFMATLGWGIFVFGRFGHLEPAAVLAGALVDGPLAELSRFPGVAQSHADPALARLSEIDRALAELDDPA
jgi:hypothetical protein